MVLLTINPFLTREPWSKGFEGITTKYALYNTCRQNRPTACMQDKTEYLVMAHGREESVQKVGMSLVTNKRVSTGSNSQLERAARQEMAALYSCFSHRVRGSPQRVPALRSVDDARPPISPQGSAHKSRPSLSSRQGPSRGPSPTGGSTT